MNLAEDQLKSVAAWFAGGASLDEIQKRLVAEYGVHLTYFELRMLVAELPQPEEATGETPVGSGNGQDARCPSGEATGETPVGPGNGQDARCPSGEATDETPVGPEEPSGEPGAANVTVECDAIMIPGTMASGDVTFSDGVKGKWYLDQMGRLGLGGDLPQGYRPSPEDAALFQARLMEALRAKGLC